MADDDDRAGFSETLIKIAVALGASETKMRWRFQRLGNWWRRSKRKTARRVEQVKYENKICPSCRSINSADEKRCSECGGRLGSRVWQVLDRVGLVVPQVVSASTLLGICFIAVYARILFAQQGDSAWSIDVYTLLRFGGNHATYTFHGDPWRLLSSIVSHAGLWHLGFNLVALYIVGPEVEKLYGRFVMPLLFALTGVVGSIASAYLNTPPATSIGASGGILGLIGLALIRGHLEGGTAGRQVRDRMIQWTLYIFIFGFVIGADNWAHAGGLAAGVAIGYAIQPGWIADHPGRRLPLSILGVAAAGAAVWLAVAPPASKLDNEKRHIDSAEVVRSLSEICPLPDGDDKDTRLAEITRGLNPEVTDWCRWLEQARVQCKSTPPDDLPLRQKREHERICGAIRPTD